MLVLFADARGARSRRPGNWAANGRRPTNPAFLAERVWDDMAEDLAAFADPVVGPNPDDD